MVQPKRKESAPSWLTEAFVENALRIGFNNENLKVVKTEMKMATSVGENYGSLMFRLNLTISTKPGSDENLSIIVKATQVGQLGEEMRKASCFEKEEKAFAEVLPECHKLLQKAYPNHPRLWANCYYHMGHPFEVLILEDLRPRGFVLGNRFEGLDLEHSLLVIKSLAKFHSTSAVVLDQNPGSLELYDSQMWSNDNRDTLSKFSDTKCDIFADEILKWPYWDGQEKLAEKVRNLKGTYLDRILKMWERDESKMNVLLHGDAWVNNFMFRYEPAGKLSEMNFVDFQLITRNCPTLDLHYFIYSSVKPEIKFNSDLTNLLLKAYHETFVETLKRLQYNLKKPFTFDQLKKDFEEKFFWGFFILFNIFPIFVVPSSEVFHPDDFFKPEGDLVYKKVFGREDQWENFKKGLIFFEEKECF